MQAKPLVLLAALAFAGVALSGCLEAPSFLFTADTEATAREHLDVAQGAAQAWSPDAKLVAVFSLESADAEEAELPTDPEIGNGRAVAWWYTFHDGNESRVYRVAADGTLGQENATEAEPYVGDSLALGEWQVDSDRALETARGNETFRAVAEGGNASFAEGVANEEGATHWFVAAYSESGMVWALLDARTGELTSVETLSFDFGWLGSWGGSWGSGMEPEVEMSEEGSLDGSETFAEFPFTLQNGGQEAMFSLSIEKRFPTDALSWSVVDGSDEVVQEGTLGRMPSMGDSTAEEFTLDAPGDYRLVLEYRGAGFVPLGAVDYSFEFIVGGAAGDFDWGDWG